MRPRCLRSPARAARRLSSAAWRARKARAVLARKDLADPTVARKRRCRRPSSKARRYSNRKTVSARIFISATKRTYLGQNLQRLASLFLRLSWRNLARYDNPVLGILYIISHVLHSGVSRVNEHSRGSVLHSFGNCSACSLHTLFDPFKLCSISLSTKFYLMCCKKKLSVSDR